MRNNPHLTKPTPMLTPATPDARSPRTFLGSICVLVSLLAGLQPNISGAADQVVNPPLCCLQPPAIPVNHPILRFQGVHDDGPRICNGFDLWSYQLLAKEDKDDPVKRADRIHTLQQCADTSNARHAAWLSALGETWEEDGEIRRANLAFTKAQDLIPELDNLLDAHRLEERAQLAFAVARTHFALGEYSLAGDFFGSMDSSLHHNLVRYWQAYTKLLSAHQHVLAKEPDAAWVDAQFPIVIAANLAKELPQDPLASLILGLSAHIAGDADTLQKAKDQLHSLHPQGIACLDQLIKSANCDAPACLALFAGNPDSGEISKKMNAQPIDTSVPGDKQ